MATPRVLGLFLLALLPACVTFTWERRNLFAVPEAADGEGLPEIGTELSACLSMLGAPLLVWEYAGSGVALAYAWGSAHELGFRVSVPVQRFVSASFDYGTLDDDLRGLVLLFDEDLNLTSRRIGYLRELELQVRRAPAPLPAEKGSQTDRSP